MWVLVVLAAVVGFFGAHLLITSLIRHQRYRANGLYFRRYQQLIAKLELLTRRFNLLGDIAKKIDDHGLLDLFQSCLNAYTRYLQAMQLVKPLGNNPESLAPAYLLMQNCEHQVGEMQAAFVHHLSGNENSLSKRRRLETELAIEGCYFCSRPVILQVENRIRVKIDGRIENVISCRFCADELRHCKKVKVLYFLQNGHPVHWSQVKGYEPSERFWTKRIKAERRYPKRLELIKDDE